MKNKPKAPRFYGQDPIQVAQNKYTIARLNIFFVAIFSFINVLLLALGTFSYFLFSASLPYLIVDLGMYLCGRYPEDFYEGGYESFYFFDNSLFFIMLAIALVVIAFYILCYLLSNKNRVGWMIAALVFFSIDTIIMFTQYDLLSNILDIIFHIYVIVCFALGIKAYCNMRKLEKEKESAVDDTVDIFSSNGSEASDDTACQAEKRSVPDSIAIREADLNVKARVFFEVDSFGHKIIYRRVKRVNELIIDGNVYDEYTALIEKPHMLTAVIDGHDIAAGFDGIGMGYVTVDGHVAAKKPRLV